MLILMFIFATAVQPTPTDSPRQRFVVEDWRFLAGDSTGAARVEFDDGDWERVRTPHTWNARDGQDGGNDYRRGPAWYRTRVEVPPGPAGRRVFIRFNAASLVADVHVNGQSIGQHRGGFAAFCFEITEQLPPAGERGSVAIAVRVDNSTQDDVAPLSGDFTIFGGLYRPVELVFTDTVCVSPLDNGSPGVCLSQVELTDERALVDARVLVSNGRASPVNAEVRCTVFDAAGGQVAMKSEKNDVASKATASVTPQVTIENPHRWQGRDDPYLYTVRVDVVVDGHVVDRVDQPLGLRTFRVDIQKGFFLNDKPYPLYGVNRHQDRQDKGWAIGRSEMEEDFAILGELGCSAVRLAHYQHDDYAYTLADRAGLVVWAEIPLVDMITDSAAFRTNCRQQLIELIRQNRNHPSICFWGIHNEVTAPWRNGPDATPLVRELHELAKTEDPGRLTTCAATDPVEHTANWQTDLTAFNRYFGWYLGSPDEFGTWCDRTHAAHPKTPLGISEYGAGASIAHHAWPASMPKHNGEFHPEEWQAQLHRAHWQAMTARPYLWCNLVWNCFDFASDSRKEGDTAGRNDKGLVTYDRRTRKEAFLWYQSQWSRVPVVQIACRGASVNGAPLRIYSNCETVTLFVDGVAHGPREVAGGLVEWEDIQLSPGSHALRAVGMRRGERVESSCAVAPPTTMSPATLPVAPKIPAGD